MMVDGAVLMVSRCRPVLEEKEWRLR